MTRGERRLAWVGAGFFLIATATRIVLAVFSGDSFGITEILRFMAVGLLFDLAVAPWLLLPWALYDALTPRFTRHPALARWENRWAALWGLLFLGFLLAVAGAELAFWGEFRNRFDFIAVDYLVYTHEVIGNIVESYPIGWWVAVLAVVSGLAVRLTWPDSRGAARGSGRRRGAVALAVAANAALSLGLMDQNLAECAARPVTQQLSNNGLYALFHAYRHNQLSYDTYYPKLDPTTMNATIRALVRQSNTAFTSDNGIERTVTAHGPRRDVNVVLISVESLSAEYLGRFGNTHRLTPELDALADRGLLFSNLYATGTRTVRGLEALSVGTPPTPGQSILRRPGNAGLETLGEELKENGWNPYWVYGGYGFFDNMNAFFAANGYGVVDRTDIDKAKTPVHGANVWGVADEDLFTLAMTRMDREYAQGNRFFTHIMTTSNHRPYTFPEQRVDFPQKDREGAVAYTDWAIGDFIRRSAAKPWFDNTVFIIIADHTAKAAGKTDLPPERYHIPMIWYAPRWIEPAVMPRLMSQIDVVPTLLGWLGLDYTSRFFGYDLFTLELGRERAFISTYQTLGYLKDGRLATLDVNQAPMVTSVAPTTDAAPPSDADLMAEAMAWYQSASLYFDTGKLRDSDPAS